MYMNESAFDDRVELIVSKIYLRVRDFYGIETRIPNDLHQELVNYTRIKCRELIEEDEKRQSMISEFDTIAILKDLKLKIEKKSNSSGDFSYVEGMNQASNFIQEKINEL